MGKKKYMHNAKSLRKYKVKELRNFIKDNKLPVKATSKMSKAEIVGTLLKLQRNGHCDCFNKLAIREKKKLSPLQQQALLKGQNAMKERRRLMKEEVNKSQKLDKKKIKVPTKSLVQEPEIIEEIIDIVKDESTQLENIKQEGLPNQVFDDILGLDEIFKQADKESQKDKDFFNDLFGLTPEKEKEEEKTPETPEIPIDLTETPEEISKEEENFIKKEIGILNMNELKQIAKDNKLKGYSQLKKDDLVDFIYNNREKIDDLDEIIEMKRLGKL